MTMNKTLIKTAERYEETARRLLEKAKLLRAGIDPNKCTYGEYTNKFFGKECKKCGSPKTVMCDIEADGRVSHSSKKCNPVKCDKFKPQTADK